MESPCVQTLSPVVKVFSLGLSAGGEGMKKLCGIVQGCSDAASQMTDAARRALVKKLDDELLCAVVCCCEASPSVSATGRNGMQECMKQTLRKADSELNWKSRYKAEIAYNMEATPRPVPFMHRDPKNKDSLTTEPSRHWQTRAKEDIESFKGGQGQVRIPDVVIVNDPSRPPDAVNIDRVVELKFEGDRLSKEQEEDYTDIAGRRSRFTVMGSSEAELRNVSSSTKNCDCRRGRKRSVPQEVYAPSVKNVLDRINAPGFDWKSLLETAGWGVVTVLGTAATIALLISPFEGPAGEVAAGAGTAAAGARTASAARALFQSLFARPALP